MVTALRRAPPCGPRDPRWWRDARRASRWGATATHARAMPRFAEQAEVRRRRGWCTGVI